MQNTSRNHRYPSKLLYVWIILAIVVIIPGIIYVFEKTGITNLYTKPEKILEQTTKDINTIDYSPATDAEKPDTTLKTQDNPAVVTGPAAIPNDKPLHVTLSAAGQDTNGGPIIIRSIIENATGGTCSVTLEKDSTKKEYTSPVVWRDSYYSCEGFDIPYQDLSPGSWQLNLRVTQNNKSEQITQTVNVTAN